MVGRDPCGSPGSKSDPSPRVRLGDGDLGAEVVVVWLARVSARPSPPPTASLTPASPSWYCARAGRHGHWASTSNRGACPLVKAPRPDAVVDSSEPRALRPLDMIRASA